MPSGKVAPTPEGRDMIMNMLVDTGHHLAQGEICRRVKGIKPTDCTF